jgi:hypothetical protein
VRFVEVAADNVVHLQAVCKDSELVVMNLWRLVALCDPSLSFALDWDVDVFSMVNTKTKRAVFLPMQIKVKALIPHVAVKFLRTGASSKLALPSEFARAASGLSGSAASSSKPPLVPIVAPLGVAPVEQLCATDFLVEDHELMHCAIVDSLAEAEAADDHFGWGPADTVACAVGDPAVAAVVSDSGLLHGPDVLVTGPVPSVVSGDVVPVSAVLVVEPEFVLSPDSLPDDEVPPDIPRGPDGPWPFFVVAGLGTLVHNRIEHSLSAHCRFHKLCRPIRVLHKKPIGYLLAFLEKGGQEPFKSGARDLHFACRVSITAAEEEAARRKWRSDPALAGAFALEPP